jgi:Tfp pilus assembly protein PilF
VLRMVYVCSRRAGRRRPTRVSRGILPMEGDKLLQQANLALVKGDSATAVKQIMECIRSYPNFTEPYMFLAATYEILNQPQNSLHCYAIALHMKPSDRNIAFECATKSEGVALPDLCIWC